MAVVGVTPRLFPAIEWFLYLPPQPVINVQAKWDKRDKATHRYRVADVHGPIELTMPLEKPRSFTESTLADISISRHGNWWHNHRVTLESGYGRTPYFEYYFPKLEKFFSADTIDAFPLLSEYLVATTNTLFEMLDLPQRLDIVRQEVARRTQEELILPEYYQIRAARLGFITGLSILDLLFNIGPEAQLYLRCLNPTLYY